MFWAVTLCVPQILQEESEQDLWGSPFNLLCLLLDYGAQCRRGITLSVVFSNKSPSVKFFGRICFVSFTPPSLLISTPDAQTAPSNITGRLSEHSISIMKSKCLLHKISFRQAISKKKNVSSVTDEAETESCDSKEDFSFSPSWFESILGEEEMWWATLCWWSRKHFPTQTVMAHALKIGDVI